MCALLVAVSQGDTIGLSNCFELEPTKDMIIRVTYDNLYKVNSADLLDPEVKCDVDPWCKSTLYLVPGFKMRH